MNAQTSYDCDIGCEQGFNIVQVNTFLLPYWSEHKGEEKNLSLLHKKKKKTLMVKVKTFTDCKGFLQ